MTSRRPSAWASTSACSALRHRRAPTDASARAAGPTGRWLPGRATSSRWPARRPESMACAAVAVERSASSAVAVGCVRARAMPALSSTASRTAPVAPGEDVANHGCVVRCVTAAQGLRGVQLQPETGRLDRAVADLPVADPPHGRRRGHRHLVEPVVTAEDRCVLAPTGEDAGEQRRHPGVGAADRGVGRLGRVGQRAEEVEGAADAELSPRHGRVPEGRMEGLGEAERDARLAGPPRRPAPGGGTGRCPAPRARRPNPTMTTLPGCRA